MSSAERPRSSGIRFETLLAGLIILLIVGALFFLSSQRQQGLRASPAGFNGLQIWLTSEGQSAQNFTGGWLIDRTNVGLLVLPLFDTLLDRERVSPRTKQELLFQQDESDQLLENILEKAGMARTLIILPKWRSGMRLTGLGHPALLAEEGSIERVLRQVTGSETAQLTRIRRPFSNFTYQSAGGDALEAQLYVAQVFESDLCMPLIGQRGQMLLADCPLAETDMRALVLSDPDLLNNHGLRLGDNAQIGQDFIAQQAGDAQVLIDYSSGVWLKDPSENTARERTWADLLRFFEPPFSILWVSAALFMALVLWRSAVRYGPVLDLASSSSASKALAIRARARLLRLTDQDGALLSEYAAARISATASRLFGPSHTRNRSDEEAVLRHLERNDPRHAAYMKDFLTRIHHVPKKLGAVEAIAYVDEFEDLLEKITNDA